MKFILSLIIATIALNTCSNTTSEKEPETIVFINSAKVDCTGVVAMKCLQIQESETLKPNEWQNFYSTIEGFNYEPGYIYKLSITKEKLDPETVPADASSIKYSLVKVIEKTLDKKMRLNDIWALKAINGEAVDLKALTARQKQPVLEIHLSELKIIGNDGCNAIFGTIETLDENNISFGSIGSTRMACPDMTLPTQYTNALEKTKQYSLKDLHLYLYDSEGNELLKFLKVD